MISEIKNTDSRLISAYEAIDSGKVEILSLDIFDTLLWRKTATFKDLFFILGRRLKSEGWFIPGVRAENFCELRVLAKHKAQKESICFQGVSEVCLSEIYWKMQGIFVQISVAEMLEGTVKGLYDSDVSELVKMEVALEKEFIRFDTNLVHLIFYAKQKNIPVIFVSDTHFKEPDILNFFDQPVLHHAESFLPLVHKLFISCEYGYSKDQGLFKHVLEELKVAPSKILHIGDNYNSDVLSASKEGIATIFYSKFDKKFDEAFDREWPKDPSQRHLLLDSDQGDFGISALRSKIYHHIALKEIEKKDQFFWQYGAMVLGPILWGFVHWIYDRCYEMKEHQVFCLMREGNLYAKLIDRFAPYYPKHTLKAHRLWVSRRFIHHAAIIYANADELNVFMWAMREHYTVEDYCTHLGLDIQKMRKWSKYKDVVLDDPLARNELIKYIIKQKPLRVHIIQCAKAKRKRFLDYLSGLANLSDCRQMTLIDIGWSGSAQSAMQRIFQTANLPIKLHGLYLGINYGIYHSLLEGVIGEGYLINEGQHCGTAHIKGLYVLEETATGEMGVGSLLDIEEGGRIITSPSAIPLRQKKQAALVQQGIFAFFDLIGPYVQSGSIKWDSKSEALRNQLRSQFLRSMNNPTSAEAIKFGPWSHEQGPTDKLRQYIAKDAYYDRFIKEMLPVMALKETGLNWVTAYAAKHSKYLTMMSELVLLKKAHPLCFLSTDNFVLRVFLDTGKGFSKKATKSIDLHSNPNRSFYTIFKIHSFKKPIEKIRLTLIFPSALVRIRSLRFAAYNKKTSDPQLFTYFEDSESKTESNHLECMAAKQIDFNTFYCEEELKFVQTFDVADIYLIKVNLCCEMFNL